MVFADFGFTSINSINTTDWSFSSDGSWWMTLIFIWSLFCISKQAHERHQGRKIYHNEKFYSENRILELSCRNNIDKVPEEVWHLIFFCSSSKDIVTCANVCKSLYTHCGDQSQFLWKNIFLRDYKEDGSKFQAPQQFTWRHYYFRHNLSRAVEIARSHTSEDDCYVVIHGQVYDVTTFLYTHPGGHQMILDCAGTDASTVWDQFDHSIGARNIMKSFKVNDPILNKLSKYRLSGSLQIVVDCWKQDLTCSYPQKCYDYVSNSMRNMFRRLYS